MQALILIIFAIWALPNILTTSSSWVSSDFEVCYSLYKEREEVLNESADDLFRNYPNANASKSDVKLLEKVVSKELAVMNATLQARCSKHYDLVEIGKLLEAENDWASINLWDRFVVNVSRWTIRAIAYLSE